MQCSYCGSGGVTKREVISCEECGVSLCVHCSAKAPHMIPLDKWGSRFKDMLLLDKRTGLCGNCADK